MEEPVDEVEPVEAELAVVVPRCYDMVRIGTVREGMDQLEAESGPLGPCESDGDETELDGDAVVGFVLDEPGIDAVMNPLASFQSVSLVHIQSFQKEWWRRQGGGV